MLGSYQIGHSLECMARKEGKKVLSLPLKNGNIMHLMKGDDVFDCYVERAGKVVAKHSITGSEKFVKRNAIDFMLNLESSLAKGFSLAEELVKAAVKYSELK